MLKKAKILMLALVVAIIGVFSANAATSKLVTLTDYTLQPKIDYIEVAGLKASYSYAKAYMTVDAVTSGTAKTRFMAYLSSNGEYTLKSSKTVDLVVYSCLDVNIGQVGSGTWKLRNQSYGAPLITYAGWSGELVYSSAT